MSAVQHEAATALDLRRAQQQELCIYGVSINADDMPVFMLHSLVPLQDQLAEAKEELAEIKDELKSAVKREAAKALELSRAQQDLLLAEKASTKLQAERDDLAKKVRQWFMQQLTSMYMLTVAACQTVSSLGLLDGGPPSARRLCL